jgi:hypothetical protein
VASFLIDNNISPRLVHELIQLGHEATHARFEGMARAKDGALLLHAAQLGAIMVTENGEDFELPHDAWHRWSASWGCGEAHAGILIIPAGLPVEYLATRLVEREHIGRGETHKLGAGYVWRQIPFRS